MPVVNAPSIQIYSSGLNEDLQCKNGDAKETAKRRKVAV